MERAVEGVVVVPVGAGAAVVGIVRAMKVGRVVLEGVKEGELVKAVDRVAVGAVGVDRAVVNQAAVGRAAAEEVGEQDLLQVKLLAVLPPAPEEAEEGPAALLPLEGAGAQQLVP